MISTASGGLARRIARALLTRWAWRCGTTPERATTVALAVVGALVGGSILLAVWLWVGQHFRNWTAGVGIVPVLIVQGCVLITMLLTSLSQAVLGQPGMLRRSLHPLPVPTRVLAGALHLPALALVVALAGIALPVGTVVVAGMTGYGFAHGAAVVLHSILLGALAGALLTGLLRGLTWSAPRLGGYLPTMVLLVWVAYAALSGWRFRTFLLTSGNPADLFREGALLWPVGAAFVLVPNVLYAAVGLAMAAVLAGLLWLQLGSVRAMGSTFEPQMPVRLRFRAEQSAPLFRVELARLLRHRHTASWGLSTLAILAGGVVVVSRMAPSEQGAVTENLLLVSCVLAGHVPLLARGLSSRHRPYLAVLGFPVTRWINSMVLAATLLAAIITIPFFLLLALAVADLSILATGAGLLAFVVVVASVVGVVLTPSPENAGGELAGAFAVFVATGVTGYIVHSLLDASSVLPVAVIMGFLGLAVSWAPARIETMRWQRDTGRARSAAGLAR